MREIYFVLKIKFEIFMFWNYIIFYSNLSGGKIFHQEGIEQIFNTILN